MDKTQYIDVIGLIIPVLKMYIPALLWLWSEYLGSTDKYKSNNTIQAFSSFLRINTAMILGKKIDIDRKEQSKEGSRPE